MDVGDCRLAFTCQRKRQQQGGGGRNVTKHGGAFPQSKYGDDRVKSGQSAAECNNSLRGLTNMTGSDTAKEALVVTMKKNRTRNQRSC